MKGKRASKRAGVRAAAGVTCPDWLEEMGRDEWARLVADGVIVPTPENAGLLALYCQSYARWRASEQLLTAEGVEVVVRDDKGVVKSVAPSPHIGISMKYQEKMLRASAALGIYAERPGKSTATRPMSTGRAPAADESAGGFFGAFPGLQ